MSIVVLEGLHEQLVGPRDVAALSLDLDHGGQALQLGLPIVLIPRHPIPSPSQTVRQLRTQAHPPSHPCRGSGCGRFGTADFGNQTLERHQRHRVTCKHKGIALLE